MAGQKAIDGVCGVAYQQEPGKPLPFAHKKQYRQQRESQDPVKGKPVGDIKTFQKRVHAGNSIGSIKIFTSWVTEL
jgi:hypothetical protein